MDHFVRIAGSDLHGRMLGARRGPADQQRNVHPQSLHLAGDVDHLLQAGRDQPAQADHVGLALAGRLQDLLAGDHHAQVDDLVVVTAQYDAYDVLADIVDVALDRGHHDRAACRGLVAGGARAGGQLLGLHEGHEVGHGLFHHTGAFHDLRQEHLAVAEQVADDLDAGHQRPFDDVQAGGVLLPGLFHVGLDMIDDAVDQRVLEPFLDRSMPPGRVGLVFLRGLALQRGPVGHQPLGGVGAAVENHVFHTLAERRLDVLVDGQLPGVDDPHVEPGVDGVVQEGGVEGLADRVVAAKGEGDVAHAPGDFHVRQQLLDLPRGLDEVQSVAGVFLDARADGQDVRVEDDVGRFHAGLFREQLIGPAGDVDLVLDGDGLALFVEHHHHACRAVLSHQPGVGQELLFALLEADRVDDRLALHTLQARFQHGPVRAVDHHGHAGHVGLGGQQVEELGHDLRPVQEALVHVDIDDVRPALNLLASDGNGFAQVALADQPGEFLRSRDIGPLADHDEGAVGTDHQRFQAAEDGVAVRRRRAARRTVVHGVGDGADVGRRRAAAAADDVHPAALGKFAQHGGHLRRRLVVAAELVGKPGVGMTDSSRPGKAAKAPPRRAASATGPEHS